MDTTQGVRLKLLGPFASRSIPHLSLALICTGARQGLILAACFPGSQLGMDTGRPSAGETLKGKERGEGRAFISWPLCFLGHVSSNRCIFLDPPPTQLWSTTFLCPLAFQLKGGEWLLALVNLWVIWMFLFHRPSLECITKSLHQILSEVNSWHRFYFPR